jgi:hypothetical protein
MSLLNPSPAKKDRGVDIKNPGPEDPVLSSPRRGVCRRRSAEVSGVGFRVSGVRCQEKWRFHVSVFSVRV